MRMTVPQNMRTLKSMGQHQRLIRKNLSRQAFGNYNASIQAITHEHSSTTSSRSWVAMI